MGEFRSGRAGRRACAIRCVIAHSSPTTWTGRQCLTFTRSHDLFGDNSVILVDLHGHTPGSVGVLAHTQRGWILIAGDAAWHQLQIENARQKSGYPGVLVDEDRDETFKTLQRLHLARQAVTVIPTHDHQAALRFA